MSAGTEALAPDWPDLLGFGRRAWDEGRREEAVRSWRRAAVTTPGRAAAYVNLAGAGAGGEWVETAAERIDPGDPVIARNLGISAGGRGSERLALARLRRAVVLSPEETTTVAVFMKRPEIRAEGPHWVRWIARGAVLAPGDVGLRMIAVRALLDAGRAGEALEHARRVQVPLHETPTEFLELISHLHVATADMAGAVPATDLLIERNPTRPGPRAVRAMLYRRLGDPARGIEEARRANLLAPGSFDAAAMLATAYSHDQSFEQAIRMFRCCLRIAPQRRDEILENYAICAQHQDDEGMRRRLVREFLVVKNLRRPKIYAALSVSAMRGQDLGLADRYARIALALDPTMPEGIGQLGAVRRHQGRAAEARDLINAALGCEMPRPEHRFNLALLELADGDVDAGLAAYEVRWEIPRFPAYRRPVGLRALPAPRWQGEENPAAVLAVWGEQGVGDELWFAGYLRRAEERVGRVILEVTPHLVDLMRRSFPSVEVLPRGSPQTDAVLATADLQLPMGDLLRIFGAGGDPVPTGYLAFEAERAAELRRRYTVGRTGARVIGLSWRSVKPARKLSFEASLAHWKPLFDLPDTVFVSLQYGGAEADAKLVRDLFGVELIVDGEIDAYRNLDPFAPQVAATDLVVSVANSTVAVAHGLGKPVHVILQPVQEDWRYARHQPVTRWLPTARCVWSTTPGGWATAIAATAREVAGDGG